MAQSLQSVPFPPGIGICHLPGGGEFVRKPLPKFIIFLKLVTKKPG